MENSLITDEIRGWIGRSEPAGTVEVSRREIIRYALASEQRLKKFLNGDEAPVMFLFGLFRPLVPIDDLGPDGLAAPVAAPDLPLKRIMAGGVQIEQHQPIKPGQRLTGTRTLTNISEKSGKQGPLIFLTYRLAVTTETGEPVADEYQTRIAR